MTYYYYYYYSFNQAYPDASDEEDHVDIENIEPYASPGSLLNRTTQQTPLGQPQAGEMTKTKKVNPYDNVTESPDDPDGERRYLNIEEMREHERMSSCECFFLCLHSYVLFVERFVESLRNEEILNFIYL